MITAPDIRIQFETMLQLRCLLLSALLWLVLGGGAFAEPLVVGYSAVTSVFLPFWIGEERLYGVALLPVQNISAAAEELERCVKDLHMVGGVIPAAYPHERPTLEEFLLDIPHFQAREDLSDKVKKLILRDNCSDFYSLRI